MKRGERKARWMLGWLDAAGVEVQFERMPDGEHGIRFPNGKGHSPEQRDIATDLMLFDLGGEEEAP